MESTFYLNVVGYKADRQERNAVLDRVLSERSGI